ncbi:MAG: universal stress protein [Solirubrobacterales bacterium]|nr:universal stress protein [Solirubrobacterales bacterium]
MAESTETHTIVLGYDGSDAARRGLSRVRGLVADAASVVVVSVTPELPSGAIGSEPLVGRDFDAERLLAEAAELLGHTDGTTVERRMEAGDPAAVLIGVAREVDADLLIVGRRGSDFVTRTLLGSVAQRVVQNARCDVLVVA